jgi:hypothetical protein
MHRGRGQAPDGETRGVTLQHDGLAVIEGAEPFDIDVDCPTLYPRRYFQRSLARARGIDLPALVASSRDSSGNFICA